MENSCTCSNLQLTVQCPVLRVSLNLFWEPLLVPDRRSEPRTSNGGVPSELLSPNNPRTRYLSQPLHLISLSSGPRIVSRRNMMPPQASIDHQRHFTPKVGRESPGSGFVVRLHGERLQVFFHGDYHGCKRPRWAFLSWWEMISSRSTALMRPSTAS